MCSANILDWFPQAAIEATRESSYDWRQRLVGAGVHCTSPALFALAVKEPMDCAPAPVRGHVCVYTVYTGLGSNMEYMEYMERRYVFKKIR